MENPPKAKLYWRCRRGMKELDIVMLRYLDRYYDLAPEAERQAFIALLDVQDPQLWSWVTGREQPDDPVMADVLAKAATAV